jgi:hypothetical protein
MKVVWRTAWRGQDIVVYRDDDEVDRLSADRIERVIFVHRGRGETPSDLVYALVQTSDDFLFFPANTGFAGRVNFERQEFWTERACVYWVPESRAPLPVRFRSSHWWLRLSRPTFIRVPREQLLAMVSKWPLGEPQTWDQRKWQHIQRSRPFADLPVNIRA